MKKSRLFSLILAMMMFCVFVLLTWLYVRPTEGSYRIVCLGDSLIGNEREDTVVTDVMEEVLGEKVWNGAFGGTCMSKGNTGNRPDYYEDSLSMCELADAIASQDFTRQQIDITNNQFKLGYFDESVRALAQIDFSKAEVLIIEHGTNDYNSGRPIDNEENPFDCYTFGGALRYSISTIQKAYPDLRLILVTPPYCFFERDGEVTNDCYSLDYGYGNLEKYAELEIAIAEEYGIESIDVFHEIGINEENAKEYLYDGVHFNREGRKLFGETIAGYLLETSD